jgi:hypothetical protein
MTSIPSSLPSSTAGSLAGSLTSGGAASGLNSALGGSGSGSSTSATDGALNNALGAGSSSTGDSIADSASQGLQQISDQIAALAAQSHAANTQEFDKTTQDVLYDNNATARSIGQLRLNTTRIGVVNALSAQDQVDVFSFAVTTSGAAKIASLINDPSAKDQTADASGNVRFQIFAQGKGLVADSDPNAGQAYTNYQALKNGTFDLSKGQYTIRVSRADGVDPQNKNTYNYAFQLTQGTTFTQDFTTTEQAYTPGTDDPFGLGSGSNDPGSILADGLSDAFSFISQLPAIGTSGTSKLLGFIYSSQI